MYMIISSASFLMVYENKYVNLGPKDALFYPIPTNIAVIILCYSFYYIFHHLRCNVVNE